MEKLKLTLKNCHGINTLNYTFDFQEKDYIIYAINGTMKTSLYNTFDEYRKDEPTKDIYFPERVTTRIIKDGNNVDVKKDSIILIGNDDYIAEKEKITSLLINNDLKRQYDQSSSVLNEKFDYIAKKIKSKSGEKIDTMLKDIGINNLSELAQNYFSSDNIIDFQKNKYSKLFTDDNLEILNQENISSSINDYTNVCNQIIDEHSIFVKDIFELYNLKNIKKTLDSNNYFNPGHILKMKINNGQDLYQDYTDGEITNLIIELDKKLAHDSRIAAVNLSLTSKVKSHELKLLLSQNSWLIPYLGDIEKLKKEYWHFIIAREIEIASQIREYVNIYIEKQDDLKRITEEAGRTENHEKWNDAITVFNNKFVNMPFKLRIKDISDVILKNKVCSLAYEFSDVGGNNPDVDENILKLNLSKGERKAFNILNLIFEIQYRRNNNIESLIIIDDIADSFDYKNKYAIIEYLKELNDDPLFKIIVLTHNFDFYRTCVNRLNLKHLVAIKGSSIMLEEFYYTKNVFSSIKSRIDDPVYFIASIPFVRNIIELSKGEMDQNYKTLTSALHYKQDTSSLIISNISSVYLSEINKQTSLKNQSYLDLLFKTADSFILGNTNVNLSNKLVLSIAIRLKFEIKIFQKINDWQIVNGFLSNQTYEMIDYCIKNDLLNSNEIKISNKVRIMTSENIHVNAFMYEPIIDMSDDELICLYEEIKLM